MKTIEAGLVNLFTNLNSFLLFLLIAFPVGIQFTSPNYPIANLFLSSIGGFFLLCWIYAIGTKAAQSIKAQSSLQPKEQLFKALFTLILLLAALAALITAKNVYPSLLTVIAVAIACLFIVAVTMAASALVSAELKRQVTFNDYFTTFLLLLFPVVGVWFIQPRLKKV